mmetsp:Transcript_11431/g.32388  ORF Transcript_11431/g.32388 Transcript_11431/m.32388 type:complete len:97 (-) Transcript_11431:132-422(-)
MSEGEVQELRSSLTKTVEIPINSKWDMRTVHPNLVQSYYFDDGTDFGSIDPESCACHLHREFVGNPSDKDKQADVSLCDHCFCCLKKKKIPKKLLL